MKIALLHYSSPPIVGGVESVIAHHARLMTKAGHMVTIISGRGESFHERIPVKTIPLIDSRHHDVMVVKKQLDGGKCTQDFYELRERIQSTLLDEVKEFDLLIAHNVASLHKNLALTAAIFEGNKQPGFPRLILWHHDLAWTTNRYRHELYDGYPWNLIRTPWNEVRHIVVSNVRGKELSELSGINESEVLVIPNGVDIKAFYKLEDQTMALIDQLRLLEAAPLFLLPARLTPRKNIELALRLLAAIRQYFPNPVLLVTGPEGPHNPANAAYKSKLVNLRDELGLKGVVHFLADVIDGYLPDEVIADFFRLGDALLFPSREEGFGIPLIEAAFSSMPVFCADIPVLRELAGEDVSYFDVDDPPETTAALIVNRLKNETTSRWARAAKQKYTWESIYTLYIEPLIMEDSS